MYIRLPNYWEIAFTMIIKTLKYMFSTSLRMFSLELEFHHFTEKIIPYRSKQQVITTRPCFTYVADAQKIESEPTTL